MEEAGTEISETVQRRAGRYLGLGLSGLILVLLGTTVPLRGQLDVPHHLVIDAALASKLELLAGGLHTEIVLCLDGTVAGDTARVTDFSMPEPRLSTFQRSRFLPCPRRSLGVWHNHPMIDFSLVSDTTPRWTQPGRPHIARPLELCALSGKDITTAARLGHPFTVVAVDANTWCWWTRHQVQQLVQREAPQGRRVAGQGKWSE